MLGMLPIILLYFSKVIRVGKPFKPSDHLVGVPRELVVGDHRRDGGEQPQRGGEQRLRDRPGNDREVRARGLRGEIIRESLMNLRYWFIQEQIVKQINLIKRRILLGLNLLLLRYLQLRLEKILEKENLYNTLLWKMFEKKY